MLTFLGKSCKRLDNFCYGYSMVEREFVAGAVVVAVSFWFFGGVVCFVAFKASKQR